MEDTHAEKSNTNPKYIGPGVWYALHSLSANACKNPTKENISAFYVFVEIIKTSFACNKCRLHFTEFCNMYPPIQFEKSQKKDALFLWSWACHNNANTLTNKQLLEYEKAHAIHFNTQICMLEDCGGTSTPTTTTPTPASTPASTPTSTTPTTTILPTNASEVYILEEIVPKRPIMRIKRL